MGDSDNDNQRGGGHNLDQNNYHTVTFFFSRKSNLHYYFHQRKNNFHFYIISFKRTYVNCSLANFKRVASSHEKWCNERTMKNFLFLCYFLLWSLNNTSLNNILSYFKRTVSTQTGNVKSRQNPWKIHMKGFIFGKVTCFTKKSATSLKVNFFTDIFQGFLARF